MIIKANGNNISIKNIFSESMKQGGKTYPALKITFTGGVSKTELEALGSGTMTIMDDDGNVVGTHEGYTTAVEHSFTLGKITTAEQELSALEAEHAEVKGAVEIILPVLDDNTALAVKNLYPVWAVGKTYNAGDRFTYADVLYKVVQAHTSQADWVPSETPALYTIINETHAGTVEDPIPYEGNMALENGKYYTQDGVIYLCNRDTGNPVYNALSELVGHYVEVYTE